MLQASRKVTKISFCGRGFDFFSTKRGSIVKDDFLMNRQQF